MPDFSCPALLRCRPDQDAGFRLQASHLLRGRFPAPSPNLRPRRADGPSTPRVASPRPRFGLLRFRSPLLPQSLLFSLPPGTEMFQFPGFAPPIRAVPPSDGGGLPHSDIRASQDICSSARLFAACHVLPRLREPRHPSCALVSFPCSFKKRRLSLSFVHRPASDAGRRALRFARVSSAGRVSFLHGLSASIMSMCSSSGSPWQS